MGLHVAEGTVRATVKKREADKAHLPPGERERVLAEARRIQWERRTSERRQTLLGRLKDSPACYWSTIFCEQAELEDELTPEQAAEWAAWKRARGIAGISPVPANSDSGEGE